MRQTTIRFVLPLIIAGALSACAYQPAREDTYIDQEVDCRSVEKSYGGVDECYPHEYIPHTDVESVFGYIIFRSVLEGLVHGLVYH